MSHTDLDDLDDEDEGDWEGGDDQEQGSDGEEVGADAGAFLTHIPRSSQVLIPNPVNFGSGRGW
jgi:hypothetical protein